MSAGSSGPAQPSARDRATLLLPKYLERREALSVGGDLRPFKAVAVALQDIDLRAALHDLAAEQPLSRQSVADLSDTSAGSAVTLLVSASHQQPPDMAAAWKEPLAAAGILRSTDTPPRRPSPAAIEALLRKLLICFLQGANFKEAAQGARYAFDTKRKAIVLHTSFAQARALLSPECSDRRLPAKTWRCGGLHIDVRKAPDASEPVYVHVRTSAAMLSMEDMVGIVQQQLHADSTGIMQAYVGRFTSDDAGAAASDVLEATALHNMLFAPELLAPAAGGTSQPTALTKVRDVTVKVTYADALQLPARITVNQLGGSYMMTLRGGPCFGCETCGRKHGKGKDGACTSWYTEPLVTVNEPAYALELQQHQQRQHAAAAAGVHFGPVNSRRPHPHRGGKRRQTISTGAATADSGNGNQQQQAATVELSATSDAISTIASANSFGPLAGFEDSDDENTEENQNSDQPAGDGGDSLRISDTETDATVAALTALTAAADAIHATAPSAASSTAPVGAAHHPAAAAVDDAAAAATAAAVKMPHSATNLADVTNGAAVLTSALAATATYTATASAPLASTTGTLSALASAATESAMTSTAASVLAATTVKESTISTSYGTAPADATDLAGTVAPTIALPQALTADVPPSTTALETASPTTSAPASFAAVTAAPASAELVSRRHSVRVAAEQPATGARPPAALRSSNGKKKAARAVNWAPSQDLGGGW